MLKIDPDNTIYQALCRIFDILWVTVLWLVFSLPVVTFGAATTSLMAVLMSMNELQGGTVTATFWKAFCTNFKCATKVWAVLACLCCIVAADIYAVWFSPVSGTIPDAAQGITIAFALVFWVISLYIFAVIAKLYVTVWQAFKNSLLFGFRYLLHTVGLLMLSAAFAAICFFFLWYALFLIGFILYAQAQLLHRCFEHYLQISAANEPARYTQQAEGKL